MGQSRRLGPAYLFGLNRHGDDVKVETFVKLTEEFVKLTEETGSDHARDGSTIFRDPAATC